LNACDIIAPMPMPPSRLITTRLDAHDAEVLIATQPDLKFAPHWHEQWSVGAIARGVCRFACDGKVFEAHAGDVIVMRPRAVHTAGTSARHFEMAMLYLPPEWVSDAMAWPRGLLPARATTVQRDARLAEALRLAARSRRAQDIRASATQALAQALPKDVSHVEAPVIDPRVRALCEALQRDAEAVDMAALARHAGLSREHFHRLFRKTIGLTPLEYARLARMARAKRLLLQGTSASHAALDCGFADQAHFSRWFKRYFGVTPAAYGPLLSVDHHDPEASHA
jgi:AraC-like DNA-binding protein/quercetin dioxygenase-like cupin family protein